MLNMQTKLNRFDAPTQFNINQHDAAEFNAAASEIENAVVDQGGILTPAVLPPTSPNYTDDDPHQLNKSIIAGGGWIMPVSSVSNLRVVFNPTVAGAENFPPIAQFTDKFLRFTYDAQANIGAYEVQYDGFISDLLDLTGAPLLPGVLPLEAVIVEIFFDGANWRLNNTLAPVNADVNSYTIVQGDTSTAAGTFTLTSGFIKWYISGKKIWVFWNIDGSLTVADSVSISIDVVTNTSIPSDPWPDLQEATIDGFATGPYMIIALPLGFTIKTADATLILQGSHVWGGSFFFQLP